MKSYLSKYFFVIVTLMLAFQLNSQMVYPDTIKTNDRIRLLNHNNIDEYFLFIIVTCLQRLLQLKN